MKLLAVVDRNLQETMHHHLGCEIDFVSSWRDVHANKLADYAHVIACGDLIESPVDSLHFWGVASEIRYFGIPAVFVDVSFEVGNIIPRVYPEIKLASWHGNDEQLMLQLRTCLPTLFHDNPEFRNSTFSAHSNALRHEASFQQNSVQLTGISGHRQQNSSPLTEGADYRQRTTANVQAVPHPSVNPLGHSSIPMGMGRGGSGVSPRASEPASGTFRKAGFGAGRSRDDSIDMDVADISSLSSEHAVISASDEFDVLDAALADSQNSKHVQAPKVEFNSRLNHQSQDSDHFVIRRTMKDIMLGRIEFGTLIRVVHTLGKLNQTGTLEIQNDSRVIKLEFRQGKAYTSGAEALIVGAIIWTTGEYNFNTSHVLSSNSKPLNLQKLIRNAVLEHLSINPLLRFLESEFNSYIVLTNCFDIGNHPMTSNKWWEKCNGSTKLSELMMSAGMSMDTLARDIYLAWACDELIFVKSPSSKRAFVEYDSGKLRISNEKPNKDILAQSALGADSAANSQLNAIRNDLLKVRASFDKEDGYTILGLNKGCGTKALDDAYYAWINRYHTDRFVRYKDPSFVKIANELMMLMNAMYARLSKAERRSTKPMPNNCNTTVRRKPATVSSESHVVQPNVSTRIGAGRARVSTIHTQRDDLGKDLKNLSAELSSNPLADAQASIRNEALQQRNAQRAAIRPASVANIAAVQAVKSQQPEPAAPGQAVKMSDLLARKRASSEEFSDSSLNLNNQSNPSGRLPSQTWAAANVTPEQHFNTAKKKLALGLSSEAYTALAWALEAEPENPDYVIHHAYASFLVEPSKREEAIDRITAMIDVLKSGYSDTLTAENKLQLFAPYYFIGKIEIAAENYNQANDALQMAAKLNPSDLDTQRSLRYVAMQLEKATEQNKPKGKGGIFSKFIDKLNVPL